MIKRNEAPVNEQPVQTELSRFLQGAKHQGETHEAFSRRVGLHGATMRELVVRQRKPSLKIETQLLAYFGDPIRPILGLPPEEQGPTFQDTLRAALKREG